MSRRVLIGKPGLDGHDRGAQYVARVLRDGGYEVIYTGLRQPPQLIARVAVDEDVDVVGLSVLSGAHVGLATAVREALDELGAGDIALVVGGVIPEEDIPVLTERGVVSVLGPESSEQEILQAIADAHSGTTKRRST